MPPLGQLKLKRQGNLRRVRGPMEMGFYGGESCITGERRKGAEKGQDKASRRHAAITKPRVVSGKMEWEYRLFRGWTRRNLQI